MLEQVDLQQTLSEDEYSERMGALKIKMYDIGHAVYESKTPVLVVFEGWAQSGKGRTIAELTSRLDPRGFRVHPTGPPDCVEQEYPWMRRFWLATPAYGQMSIFDTSWYRRVTWDRVSKEIGKREWKEAFEDIRDFERALADAGTVIIKFFLHISKKEQARRIEGLLEDKATAWRVNDRERLEQKKRKRFERAFEDMFAGTQADYAPWFIVSAANPHWVNVQVFETLIARLEPRVKAHEATLPAQVQHEMEAIRKEDAALFVPLPDEPAAAQPGEGEPDA